MNKKRIVTIAFSFLLSLGVYAKTYFVSPSGNDNSEGNTSSPFLSIQKAQEFVNAGDTVFIRGGIYRMSENQIAAEHRIFSYVTLLDKSGQAEKPINYLAYPNENPVFNFEQIKPKGKRVIAFLLSGSFIHIKGIEIVGVQVTISRHTQSECFEIRGSNNLLEQIKMHDGMAIGVYIVSGSNNLILNCDAYNNYDSFSENGRGGNTDGFGCHVAKGDTNNIFKACRAWFNSDDGFDCINSAEPVIFDQCWAFYNGYTPDFKSRADGNGFKAGGYGNGSFEHLPGNIPKHTVQFCLAVGNKQNGFYANHHLNGVYWYNNTAYRNKRNFNMLNREGVSVDGYKKDVQGWGHELINNVSYNASLAELVNIDTSKCLMSHNSFHLKIKKNDFISLDEKQLTAPRMANGGLPEITFMHLSPKSKLANKGHTIGFIFNGNAPDLGCFESNN